MKKIVSVFFTILLVLLALAPMTLSGCSDNKAITLSDVKSGNKTATEYLNYVAKNLPELTDAKKEGVIKEILYNPSKDQVKVLLIELLEGQPQPEYSQMMEGSLSVLDNIDPTAVCMVYPANTFLLGKKVALYIMFFPYALEFLDQEIDIKSAIRHEIYHARDLYYGFDVGDQRITWDNFSRNEIGGTFFTNLGEARAYHQELYSILSDVWYGRQQYGDRYMINAGKNYVQAYFEMQKSASTDHEMSILKKQLELFDDLRPVDEPTQIKIEFNMGGEKGALRLIKAQ